MSERREFGKTLTILLYHTEDEPEALVAHCLELDVVASGRSASEAVLLLKDLVTDLLNEAAKDGTLDRVMRPAPKKYWNMLIGATAYKPSQKVEKRHIEARLVRRVEYARAIL